MPTPLATTRATRVFDLFLHYNGLVFAQFPQLTMLDTTAIAAQLTTAHEIDKQAEGDTDLEH